MKLPHLRERITGVGVCVCSVYKNSKEPASSEESGGGGLGAVGGVGWVGEGSGVRRGPRRVMSTGGPWSDVRALSVGDGSSGARAAAGGSQEAGT